MIISLLLVICQAFNRDDFTQEAYHIENPNEVKDGEDEEKKHHTDLVKVGR